MEHTVGESGVTAWDSAAVSDPVRTQFAYAEAGRVVTTQHPDGRLTQSERDAFGRVIAEAEGVMVGSGLFAGFRPYASATHEWFGFDLQRSELHWAPNIDDVATPAPSSVFFSTEARVEARDQLGRPTRVRPANAEHDVCVAYDGTGGIASTTTPPATPTAAKPTSATPPAERCS